MSLSGSALSAAINLFANPCKDRLMLYGYLRALLQYPTHATYRMCTLRLPPARHPAGYMVNTVLLHSVLLQYL
jgi:hypothetical protein